MPMQKSLTEGVNQPSNLQDLSELEQKHLPIIDAPSTVRGGEFFEITVEVGRLKPHPNELTHYIEFLDIYAGKTFLARVDFTPVMMHPKATLRIAMPHDERELRAYARCNLHGVWLGTRTVEITT